MGKRFIILFVTIIVAIHSSAAWKIVYDKGCVEQVAKNSAVAKAAERAKTIQLDSVSEKQKLSAKYAAIIATVKEAYKVSMQNIKGFGVESPYYVDIADNSVAIMKDIPLLIKYLNKRPLYNYPMAVPDVLDAGTKAAGLVNKFINIVNNGKIRNPIGNSEDKDDGYNYLDRYQRMNMANSIRSSLQEIREKLESAIFWCQYRADMNNLFLEYDPESWGTIMAGDNIANGIIQSWKDLAEE